MLREGALALLHMPILDGVTGRLRASQHLEVKSIESHGGNIQNGRRQERNGAKLVIA